MAVTVYPWTSDDYPAALDRYVADVGQPGVLRCYDDSMPPGNDIASHYQVAEAYARGWAVHFSYKMPPADVAAGNRDTDIEDLVASVPAGTRTFLTYFHEPENNSFSASDWKVASERNASIVKANRDADQDVLVGPVLMGWTLDPASERSITDWLDDNTTVYDFVAWDEYNDAPANGNPWESWADIWTKINSYMDSRQSLPQICAETGCQKDDPAYPQMTADWLLEAEADVDARGDFLAWEYFDSDVGAIGYWWLRRWNDGTPDWAVDQPCIDTYTAIQNRHRG